MSTPAPLPPRHRWKVLAAGVAANAAFSVAFSGIPMTAVLMRTGYRLDNETLGLVLGLMGLGIAISELPWGLLTDRWGDRPVLLLGLGSTAVALAAMAGFAAPTADHVPGLGWLGAGLLLVGLLGGSVNGASGRAVMTWFADGERGLAMSIRQTAVPLGGGLGALLLPAAALHFGFASLYALLAALCAVGALLAWAWVHEPHGRSEGEYRSRRRRYSSEPPLAAARPPKAHSASPRDGPLRDPAVWRIVAGIGILCAPQFAVLSFGTIYLHDVGHVGLAAITATMVAVQAGAMGMRVWSGRWTDKHHNRPAYLRACSAISVLLFAGLGAVSLGQPAFDSAAARTLLMLLLAAGGICVSAWHGVAYTELAVRAGAARAGTALGMANTSVFAVCFLAPMAIPHLQSWQGWALVWFAAGACALAALPLLATSREIARKACVQAS